MKKLTLILTLIVVISQCLSVAVFSQESRQMPISAECAVLYSPDTGEFLYTKNADVRHAMASTTKIMTALVAVEKTSLDDIIAIDSRAVGVEGSSIYLKEGEKMSMRDLLYALLLQSANDAAAAIAYHIAGDISAFAEMMNKRAKEAGALSTHFDNPHGLDSENHYTTAIDLAKISAAALENGIIAEIVSCKKHTIVSNDGQMTRVLVNHNRMLNIYKGAIGIKTGYTKKTGRCLVSAAERDGITFVCVTLDAPNDWSDHTALLDYGYSEYTRKIALNSNEISLKIAVLNGNKEEIHATNSEEISYISDGENENVIFRTDITGTLIAPIREGETIGFVYAIIKNRVVGSSPLIATEAAEAKK